MSGGQTTSDTERKIADAANALLAVLTLTEHELTKADVIVAIGHVEDWLFEMGHDEKSVLADCNRSNVERLICEQCDI